MQLAEIEAIANRSAPPTFDNTIVAMERSGSCSTRVAKAFFGVIARNTNDTLQKVQADRGAQARRASTTRSTSTTSSFSA